VSSTRASCCCEVAAYRDEDVDHLAVLVDGPVHIAPDAGNIQVGLVDKPASAGGVAARACCSTASWVKCCTHRYRVT
jgi:hypothetical protein